MRATVGALIQHFHRTLVHLYFGTRWGGESVARSRGVECPRFLLLPAFADVKGELQAVVYVEFLEDGRQVGFDGAFGDIQLAGDDFVAVAGCDHVGDFKLALGESRKPLGNGGRNWFRWRGGLGTAAQALQQMRQCGVGNPHATFFDDCENAAHLFIAKLGAATTHGAGRERGKFFLRRQAAAHEQHLEHGIQLLELFEAFSAIVSRRGHIDNDQTSARRCSTVEQIRESDQPFEISSLHHGRLEFQDGFMVAAYQKVHYFCSLD